VRERGQRGVNLAELVLLGLGGVVVVVFFGLVLEAVGDAALVLCWEERKKG